MYWGLDSTLQLLVPAFQSWLNLNRPIGLGGKHTCPTCSLRLPFSFAPLLYPHSPLIGISLIQRQCMWIDIHCGQTHRTLKICGIGATCLACSLLHRQCFCLAVQYVCVGQFVGCVAIADWLSATSVGIVCCCRRRCLSVVSFARCCSSDHHHSHTTVPTVRYLFVFKILILFNSL